MLHFYMLENYKYEQTKFPTVSGNTFILDIIKNNTVFKIEGHYMRYINLEVLQAGLQNKISE